MRKIIAGILFLVLLGIAFNNENILTGNVVLDEKLETIVVPVKAHIISDTSGAYSSFRSEESIIGLINKANSIWEPSGIYFSLEKIVKTEVSFGAIPNAINSNYEELYIHNNFGEGMLNIYLVQSLNGLNGLALMKMNSVLISDVTTVNDYRTVAHEFGHILGLRHVPSSEMLMARGRNGELLSSVEIDRARVRARELAIFSSAKL
jgi:hypothetical protein